MNIETFHGKKLLLFGKPRSLTPEEFERLLATADIESADAYGPDVAAVVEGRLVNPLEQDELDRLYAQEGVVPLDINTFEKALCSQIKPDRILMSLKLAGDRERLRAFLQNPHIDDSFFLKLLGMYDWRNEGFFDTDENRDVTAALIGRFYENPERNHNVQYSTMGLMHLLRQNRHPELIRTVATLAPLRRAVTTRDRQLRAILETLAVHPAVDETALKHFIRQGDDALRSFVALRPGLPAGLQHELAALHCTAINNALASNPDLDPVLADTFFAVPILAATMFAHIRMDDARFGQGMASYPLAVASNLSLTEAMQRSLAQNGSEETLAALAANPALKIADVLEPLKHKAVLQALAGNPAVHPHMLKGLAMNTFCRPALAGNPSSPPELLEGLYADGDAEVFSALATNPATPLAILQQLQLDSRFERAVRGNEAFGQYVQRENIGWL